MYALNMVNYETFDKKEPVQDPKKIETKNPTEKAESRMEQAQKESEDQKGLLEKITDVMDWPGKKIDLIRKPIVKAPVKFLKWIREKW